MCITSTLAPDDAQSRCTAALGEFDHQIIERLGFLSLLTAVVLGWLLLGELLTPLKTLRAMPDKSDRRQDRRYPRRFVRAMVPDLGTIGLYATLLVTSRDLAKEWRWIK